MHDIWSLIVSNIGLAMQAATALFGLLAAIEGYRASQVRVEPSWDRDFSMSPKSIDQYNMGMVHALDTAQLRSGRLAQRAAVYALLAAVFAVVILVRA
jgi:hypothetical protein